MQIEVIIELTMETALRLTSQRRAALLALYAAVYGFAPKFSSWERAYCMQSKKKLICPSGGSIYTLSRGWCMALNDGLWYSIIKQR